MKKIISLCTLIVIFIFLLCWTTDFRLFTLHDLRLIIILILLTAILMVLSYEEGLGIKQLHKKLRFNIFLAGMLMTLLLIFNYLSQSFEYYTLFNNLLICTKPIIYSTILFVPMEYVLKKFNFSGAFLKAEQKGLNKLLNDLTRREQEIFDLMINGKTNQEISEQLYISPATVKKHVQNILKKSQCSNREELIDKFLSKETEQ